MIIDCIIKIRYIQFQKLLSQYTVKLWSGKWISTFKHLTLVMKSKMCPMSFLTSPLSVINKVHILIINCWKNFIFFKRPSHNNFFFYRESINLSIQYWCQNYRSNIKDILIMAVKSSYVKLSYPRQLSSWICMGATYLQDWFNLAFKLKIWTLKVLQ